jgi:hypothetical protein
VAVGESCMLPLCAAQLRVLWGVLYREQVGMQRGDRVPLARLGGRKGKGKKGRKNKGRGQSGE